MNMTMYRATQNPDTPDLPFAQPLLSTMFRDMQNPDTPNLPFSQPMALSRLSRPNPQHTRYEYIVNGDSLWYGKMVNETHYWTESQASAYRTLGYDVRKVSETKVDTTGNPTGTPKPTPTPTGSGLSRSEVEKIIESYHGDDISLLHSHAVNFGKSISSAKLHRDSIEGKVELGNTQRAEIHTKLSDLGRSVSDVSSALEAHKFGHNGGWNPFGDIPMWVALGALAFFVVLKK